MLVGQVQVDQATAAAILTALQVDPCTSSISIVSAPTRRSSAHRLVPATALMRGPRGTHARS